MTLTGSLLFVNLTNPHPFTLGVQALNLATQAITFVASFGPSGSFYDQVGTVSADGATYWASIQHTGAPIDPWSSSSTCSPGCASGTKCCVASSMCTTPSDAPTASSRTAPRARPGAPYARRSRRCRRRQ